jgi:hypothetical protein
VDSRDLTFEFNLELMEGNQEVGGGQEEELKRRCFVSSVSVRSFGHHRNSRVPWGMAQCKDPTPITDAFFVCLLRSIFFADLCLI